MSWKFKSGDKVRIRNTDYVMEIDEVHPGASLHDPYYFVKSNFDDGERYVYSERDLAPVCVKPTLATAVGLQPQTRKILNHLEKRGSISPMEALTAYGCFRLAAQVHNLRKAGFDVQTNLKEDEAGHRYARYRLAA